MPATSILPGRFRVGRGSAGDYDRLARFHYLAGRPAFGEVFVVRYREPDPRVVAVAVLSHPAPACFARERFFGLEGTSPGARISFANLNLRTISRLIVHPQFRSLGLGVLLVKRVLRRCPTRYVEAIAQMGHVHPVFRKAGMTQVESEDRSRPAYFVFDRFAGQGEKCAIRRRSQRH